MSDLSEAKFVEAIQDYLVIRGGIPDEEAEGLAQTALREYLQSEGVEYGDEDYNWTEDEAEDIAKEELSYFTD